MEKYINDTLKWFDENQNNSNAQELFTNKIKETEEFFNPFYTAATCKLLYYLLNHFSFFFLLVEGDSTTHRTQITTPKSGRK